MANSDVTDQDTLAFELNLDDEADAPAFRLNTLARTLADLDSLLSTLESELGTGAVQWTYDADPRIRITGRVNGVDHESLERIVTRAHEGFRAEVEQSDSDPSLDAIRAKVRTILNRLKSFSDIEISATGREVLRIDRDASLGTRAQRTLVEFSEIEGLLDVINVHGSPHFVLFEHGTSNRVPCTMREEVFKDAKDHLGELVIVEGQVRYLRDGRPIKISEVSGIRRVADPDLDLTELRGALGDVTKSKSTAEFVRSIREEEDE